MSVDRRTLLKGAAAVAGASVLPKAEAVADPNVVEVAWTPRTTNYEWYFMTDTEVVPGSYNLKRLKIITWDDNGKRDVRYAQGPRGEDALFLEGELVIPEGVIWC
jgi:hypothetical protein